MDKLITSLDLVSNNPSFTFVNKRNVTHELGLNEDQFLDVGILVGSDHSQPFPPTLHDQALKATVDLVKFYKTGRDAVSTFAEQPQVKSMQYSEHFARTRSMIRFSLILSSEGSVVPLPIASPNSPQHGHGNHHPHHPQAGDVPVDLHEVFTHRLPDEIYFYLSRGLLGPQALVWLTSGQVIENPPLDNGEISEYRRFIKEVITEGQTGPRSTALALVSTVANQFWSKKPVTAHFWFEPPTQQKTVVHAAPTITQLTERVSSWLVPYAVVEEELRMQNVSLVFLLSAAILGPLFLRVYHSYVKHQLLIGARLYHSIAVTTLVFHDRLCAMFRCDGIRKARTADEGKERPNDHAGQER